MTSSLVGSEMCIRDSVRTVSQVVRLCFRNCKCCRVCVVCVWGGAGGGGWAVSYTHLTLPTICSV
eukprot:6794898-Prorocentrum_lima.AAC.1